MIASPLTPRIIFTNDPYVVSAGPNSDFNFNYEQFNQRALDRPNKNSLYLTSDSANITNFSFSIAGRALNSPGPNVILDFFDPTDEFESRIFSRDETLVSRLNHYYIAFGTDNEFLNWSNFHYVTLHHAELLHDFDKPKIIRLHLIAAFGFHQIDAGIFQENIRELDEIGDAFQVNIKTTLRSKKDTDEEIAAKTALENIIDLQTPRSAKNIISPIERRIIDLETNIEFKTQEIDLYTRKVSEAKDAKDYAKSEYNIYVSRTEGRDLDLQKANRLKAEAQRLEDAYYQTLTIRTSLIQVRAEEMQKLTETRNKLEELTSPESVALRDQRRREALEAYKNSESKFDYTTSEQESELAKIFYGYDVFDTAFKKTINLFLSELYSDDVSTFFISESTEDLLRENVFVSSNPWTLSEAIKVGDRSIELIQQKRQPIVAADQMDLGYIYDQFFSTEEEREKRKELIATVVKITYDDSKLQEYKDYINTVVSSLLPEYISIKLTNTPAQQENQIITSDSRVYIDNKPLLGIPNNRLPERTVFYQYQQEVFSEKFLELSIKIPPRQGDTDDDFYTKVNNFFRYLEVALTRRVPIEDKLILIKETDLTVINLFVNYLKTTKIGKSIIQDFNIRRNRPLVILGQTSVIYALLFGEKYTSTRITSFNTAVEEYFKKQIKPKYDKLIYEIYGSHKNILTDLQMLLEANNINESNILNNINEIAKPLLVFNHNTAENQNVFKVKVDDFKAYMRLLTIPGPIRDLGISNDGEVDAKVRREVTDFLTGGYRPYNIDYLTNFIDFLFKTPSFKSSSFYKSVVTFLEDEARARKFNMYNPSKPLGIIRDRLTDELKSLLESYIEDEEHFKLNFPYNRDPKAQLEYMHQKIKAHKYRITLDTLPFFFVSNYGFLRQPCLLFSNRVTNYNLGSSKLDRILSGAYEVLGIKHIITPTTAESQFIIQTLG